MDFDWVRFAGNLVMDLFIVAVLVIVSARLFHIKRPRIAWLTGIAWSMLFGLLVPTATGVAAAFMCGCFFALMGIANRPLPKFS